MLETFGPPSGLTCPDCSGSLWELDEGRLVHYRCHVGHQFSPEGLEEGQRDAVEGALWSAVRALEEQANLKQRMAVRAAGSSLAAVQARFTKSAAESRRQADAIRQLLFTRVADAAGPASRPRPTARRSKRTRKRRMRAAPQ